MQLGFLEFLINAKHYNYQQRIIAVNNLNYISTKRISEFSLEELKDAVNKRIAKTGCDYFSAERSSK